MEILKEREMKLLSRKRVTLLIEEKGATPSRQELIGQVASKFKVKENLVIIKHIYPQFGEGKTKLIVNIYSDEKKMKMFEHANLLKKHEKKVVEAPKEEEPAAPVEASKEEALTEKPVEKKPEEAPKVEEKPVEEAPKVDAPVEKKPAEEKAE